MGWSSHGSRGDTGLKPYDYLGFGMCWPVRILQLKTKGKGKFKAEGRPSSAVAMLRRVERLREGGKTGTYPNYLKLHLLKSLLDRTL